MKNRWLIAVMGTVLMLCLGTVYAWSYFQSLLVAKESGYGWNNSQVAWIFAIAIFCLGVSAAFAGPKLQKVGPRRMATLGCLAFSLGYAIAGLALGMRSLVLLYLGYGLLGGIGLGLGYVTPVTTVAKWFPDRKGLATGMVVMGFGLGALFMSKILAPVLIGLFDGRLSPVFYSLAGIFIVLTLVPARFMVNPPAAAKASAPKAAADLTARQAILSGRFVLMWLVFFCNITAGIAIISFQSPLLQDLWRKVDGSLAPATLAAWGATLIAVSSLFNGAGRFLWGAVSDRIGRSWTFRAMLATEITVFVGLMLTRSPWVFGILVCWVLLCYGGGFGTMPAFIGDVFGPKLMAAVYGAVLTAWGVAGVVGPQLVAVLKDRVPERASTLSFAIGAGLLGLGFLLSLLLSDRPRRRGPDHRRAVMAAMNGASTGLAALVAALPLIALLALLASGAVKGWIATLAGFLAALATATLAWRMPVLPALEAGLHGALYALFPILWILVAALWIHRLSVESGQFEIVKDTIAGLTPDRRLQALLVAFAFGAFLEGTAGYGVPVAITTAMLIGLGFPPVTAALICLVANSSPVAFAAAGVPVTVAADVARLDVMSVSRFVGLLLPPLSILVPLWLCVMLCGWRASLEVLPAILVAGFTLAGTQFLAARLLGPWTTGVLSGLATLAALGVLVRFWKPRRAWDFDNPVAAAPPSTGRAPGAPASDRPVAVRQALRAWSPWLLTSALVLVWGTGLPRMLGAPPFVASAGTAIFLAGCFSTLILPGLGPWKAAACFGRTLWSMRWTVVTVCLVLAMAYVMNAAGMSAALGLALAATGPLFPAFSALIGWVGVLLTGSDTSSNALFCGLQRATADTLGIDPALAAAANTAGGVTGKMVSPQSLSVATAAAGLAGQEGTLFRRAIGHSIAQALLVAGLTALVAAYVIP